jgi:hypothetical protein
MYNVPVEMNSASVPALPPQNSAPTYRGKVTSQKKRKKSNQKKTLLSFPFYGRQLAKSTDAFCPPLFFLQN